MPQYDVIIIGGSYAGLAAAMSLGRALRNVLIIDSGRPCNAPTPHSHNFLTRDGETPGAISAVAREQVLRYSTVSVQQGTAIAANATDSGFEVATEDGIHFGAKKLIFATGIVDQSPDIGGFDACWGISVIHCPYCHGYEVRNEATGILANGAMGFEFSKMIRNWTPELSLFTNGPSTLSEVEAASLTAKGIRIIEEKIDRLEHEQGNISRVIFKDGTAVPLKALYAKLPFRQHSELPADLGCALTESGHIQVDMFQKTTVPGVFACGDNATMMRALAAAISSGTTAGAMCNRESIEEEF